MESAKMTVGRWKFTDMLLLLVVVATLCQSVPAFQMIVHKSECILQFIDVEHNGGLVSGTFAVTDDSSRDLRSIEDESEVEMVITGPSNNDILNLKAGDGQKFHFLAPSVGHFKICFRNPTFSAKKVDFNLYVGHTPVPEILAREEHVDPIKATIGSLQDSLQKILIEQQYFKSRDLRHRRTNESTQDRLLWYTIIEYVSLTAVGLAQVYFIQLLFKRRIGYNSL